jgi:CheY-like chemotaxis protein
MSTKKTVLITDDERHMLKLLEFILSKIDINILTALSGNESIQIATTGNQIDLLIIDYMMPDMSGLDVMNALRILPDYENLPVILITARGQEDLRNQAEGMGVTFFLHKPFSPNELLNCVKKVLNLTPSP